MQVDKLVLPFPTPPKNVPVCIYPCRLAKTAHLALLGIAMAWIHSHVLLSRTSCGRLPRRLFSALSKTIRGAPEMTFGNTILKFQLFKAKALKTLNLEYQHMNMNIDPNQWPSIAADRRAFWILTWKDQYDIRLFRVSLSVTRINHMEFPFPLSLFCALSAFSTFWWVMEPNSLAPIRFSQN